MNDRQPAVTIYVYFRADTTLSEEVLRSFATLDEAKADLQDYWELMAEREMDCRF